MNPRGVGLRAPWSKSWSGEAFRKADDQAVIIAMRWSTANLLAKFARGKDPLAGVLKTTLLPYQVRGALFAACRGRVVLADDMGLGKTVQALAATELLRRRRGMIPRRRQLYASPAFFNLTSYELVLKDVRHMHELKPDLIILDEAQRIRNWTTATARTIKQLVVEFVDGRRLGAALRFPNEHRMEDDRGKLLGYRGLDRIHSQLAPILLRRTRAEVLKDLPERTDQVFRVPMTPPKLEEFREIIRELTLEENRKVVVFSEYERMTHLAGRALAKLGIGFVPLHGEVPSRKRGELIRKFTADAECRVFLSTDAGGVGLNLQAASAVVSFEPPWNPARLEQRIGRVHRLGQSRPVQVIHLLTSGSIPVDEVSFAALVVDQVPPVPLPLKETAADGPPQAEPKPESGVAGGSKPSQMGTAAASLTRAPTGRFSRFRCPSPSLRSV